MYKDSHAPSAHLVARRHRSSDTARGSVLRVQAGAGDCVQVELPLTPIGEGSSDPDPELRRSTSSNPCTNTSCCSGGLAAGAAVGVEADGANACGPRTKYGRARDTVLDVLVTAGGDGWRAKRGPAIAWQDVCVTVVDKLSGEPRCILAHACGQAQPGRLLAVMGPSGAGKSTLLDVLAGNTPGKMRATPAAAAAAAAAAARGSVQRTHITLGVQRQAVLDKTARWAVSSSHGVAASGRVLVDGGPRRLRQFRDASCYVQQEGVLLASATVREALTTAALLKLPYSVARRGVAGRVQAVIQELDLTSCADTLVGDALQGLKGISGGQKRRVSVGVELVKDPRVLFLDEPTSGLDSEAATSLVAILRRLARMGRTVIASIHQPSSTIAAMFDDLTLLAAGRTVYGGAWGGAVGFFAGCGHWCPSFVNPAEYFMSVVQDAAAVDRLAASFDQANGLLLQPGKATGGGSSNFLAGGDSSATTSTNMATGPGLQAVPGPSHALEPESSRSNVGGISTSSSGQSGHGEHQSCPLPPRSIHGAVGGSCPSAVGCALVQQQGAVVGPGDGQDLLPCGRGAGWAQEPDRGHACHVSGVRDSGSSHGGSEADSLDEEREERERERDDRPPVWLQVLVLAQRYARFWVRTPAMLLLEVAAYASYGFFFGTAFYRFRNVLLKDDFYRAACIWVSLTMMSYVPSMRAVTAWEEQRRLLKYELGQRLYGINVYYLSRYLVLLPMEMLQTSLFVTLMFFLAGYHASATNFLLFVLVFGMCQIIGESLGAIGAALTRSQASSMLLVCIALLMSTAFVGLVVPIPVYYEWAMRAGYITYAYTCLVLHEFKYLVFVNPVTGHLVPGEQVASAMGGALSEALPYGQALAVLGCQLVALELLKLLSFHYAVWRRLL